ncbi:hypothetical protein BKA70DRAFT_1400735 [Coprinopsis sp. MPI-PUGE-AT-0042]|nr:hypothetical protein BKA70DRAFT_1400735 [Coprinopsis sp. MPI-PUGE-AT-0042]
MQVHMETPYEMGEMVLSGDAVQPRSLVRSHRTPPRWGNFLLHFGPLRSLPNGDGDCRKWFSIFSVVSCIPLLAVDTFSAIRIYVLYQGDLRTNAFVGSLILTEVILITMSSAVGIRDAVFTSTCALVRANVPREVIAFGGWLIATQLALIAFTFCKLKSVSNKLHASTVRLVLYQGMALCFLVVVLLFIAIGYTLIDTTGTSDLNVIAIVVLNMQRSQQRQAGRNRERTGSLPRTGKSRSLCFKTTTPPYDVAFVQAASGIVDPLQASRVPLTSGYNHHLLQLEVTFEPYLRERQGAFCRVVLNMQRRRQRQANRNRENNELDIQFTRWFSTAPSEQEPGSILQENSSTLRRRFDRT